MSSSAGTAAPAAPFRTPTRFSPTTFFTIAAMHPPPPQSSAEVVGTGAIADCNVGTTTPATTVATVANTVAVGRSNGGGGIGGIHPSSSSSSCFAHGTAGGTTPKSSAAPVCTSSNGNGNNSRHGKRGAGAAATVTAGAKNGAGGGTGGRALNCSISPNGMASSAADKSSKRLQQQQQPRPKCQPLPPQPLGILSGTEMGSAMVGAAPLAPTATVGNNGICATPPSRHHNRPNGARRHSIRREQSANSIAIPSPRRRHHNSGGSGTGGGWPCSASSLYGTAHPYAGCYTPPSAIFYANEATDYDEVSPIFAGPKFIESPSAKSLPLPPAQWLAEAACHRNSKKGQQHHGNELLALGTAPSQDENDEAVELETELQHRRRLLGITGPGRRTAGHSSFSESSSTSSGTNSTGSGEQYQQHNNSSQCFSSIIPGNWSPPAAATANANGTQMARAPTLLETPKSVAKPKKSVIQCNGNGTENGTKMATTTTTIGTVNATKAPFVGIRMDPLHLIQACYP